VSLESIDERITRCSNVLQSNIALQGAFQPGRRNRFRRSRRFVLAQVAKVIEVARLQVDAVYFDLGKGRLGENLGGDVLESATS
jgi:hypothetical protein